MEKRKQRLKCWELALLLGLALSLLTGGWAERTQSRLAGEVLRLHVLANSDSPEDQALKLRVRDAVLAETETLLADCENRQEALERLSDATELLARTAEKTLEQAGCGDSVTAAVESCWFPTRSYEGFALPAGTYTALRVVIGEGEGHNWWCVLFPPLCLASSAETAQEALSAGVSQEDVALITGEDAEYSLKFKAVELWEEVKHLVGG